MSNNLLLKLRTELLVIFVLFLCIKSKYNSIKIEIDPLTTRDDILKKKQNTIKDSIKNAEKLSFSFESEEDTQNKINPNRCNIDFKEIFSINPKGVVFQPKERCRIKRYCPKIKFSCCAFDEFNTTLENTIIRTEQWFRKNRVQFLRFLHYLEKTSTDRIGNNLKQLSEKKPQCLDQLDYDLLEDIKKVRNNKLFLQMTYSDFSIYSIKKMADLECAFCDYNNSWFFQYDTETERYKIEVNYIDEIEEFSHLKTHFIKFKEIHRIAKTLQCFYDESLHSFDFNKSGFMAKYKLLKTDAKALLNDKNLRNTFFNIYSPGLLIDIDFEFLNKIYNRVVFQNNNENSMLMVNRSENVFKEISAFEVIDEIRYPAYSYRSIDIDKHNYRNGFSSKGYSVIGYDLLDDTLKRLMSNTSLAQVIALALIIYFM